MLEDQGNTDIELEMLEDQGNNDTKLDDVMSTPVCDDSEDDLEPEADM